jgi:hypothetical protein
VIAIRYADDTIVGFQHEHEAKAFFLRSSVCRRIDAGGGGRSEI